MTSNLARLASCVIASLFMIGGFGCRECSEDSHCPTRLACDSEGRCRQPCTGDDAITCAPDETCNGGFCEPQASETPMICEGDLGCPCFADQTCNYGFACADGVCIGASGQLNQPCRPNGNCDGNLSCVPWTQGSDLPPFSCRQPDRGGIGEPCFDILFGIGAPRCESAAMLCIDHVCRGGSGDRCAADTQCQDRFVCRDGLCELIDSCRTTSDCERGEFCCGDDRFPDLDGFCGLTPAGECVSAPERVFARLCMDMEECDPTPIEAPHPDGVSVCMDMGTGRSICGAPCEPGESSGCPAQWTCLPVFDTCTEDGDCGSEGLSCIDGRCGCGSMESGIITCTSSTATTAVPTFRRDSTCAPDPGSTEFFCRLAFQCVPPL